ncbi:MAG TPA: hypothetical protein VFI37_07635 [Gaiellaceae bacterium]|nr:hypothetical protein [Gaiellaceae bacterium]
MDSLAALTLVLAHGGTAGLIVEIAVGLAVLLVGGLAWQASRKEDDDEPFE